MGVDIEPRVMGDLVLPSLFSIVPIERTCKDVFIPKGSPVKSAGDNGEVIARSVC